MVIGKKKGNRFYAATSKEEGPEAATSSLLAAIRKAKKEKRVLRNVTFAHADQGDGIRKAPAERRGI